tara:strand:+ start:588 stop:1250 length:663 start_codon:yes stop_codon:yes gene_type:complete
MKFTYYNATISDFSHKHPSNANQLFHMLWSSFASYTNLIVTTVTADTNILSDVIRQIRLLTLDIGTSINKTLKCRKRNIHLSPKYEDELDVYVSRLPNDVIKTMIESMGSTWGALVSAIMQDIITLFIEIAHALVRGEGINDMLTRLNANTVQLLNVLQAAGNRPVLLSKGVKIWTQFNNLFIEQIQAIIAKDNLLMVTLYNKLQLQSFAMTNFFNKLIL